MGEAGTKPDQQPAWLLPAGLTHPPRTDGGRSGFCFGTRKPFRAQGTKRFCAMASHVVIRQAVGFIYPAYKSLQAVMTEEDQEDDLTWLRYWVVLAAVHMVELVVDPLVDFFPGYLLAKCAFLVWCMAPIQNNGANLIFTQIIFPLFKKHHQKIDEQVSLMEETLQQKVAKFMRGGPSPKSRW